MIRLIRNVSGTVGARRNGSNNNVLHAERRAAAILKSMSFTAAR